MVHVLDELAVEEVSPAFLVLIQVLPEVPRAHRSGFDVPILFDFEGKWVFLVHVREDVGVDLEYLEEIGLVDRSEGFPLCRVLCVVKVLVNKPEVCEHG